jgi:WD40 repeat protein
MKIGSSIQYQEAYTYSKNEKLPNKKEKKFQAHSHEGNCLQYSPCGTFLVTSGDNQLKSWKEDYNGDFTLRSCLSGLPKNLNAMCFQNNSKNLAIAVLDFKVRIVSTDNLKVTQVLSGHQDLVAGVAFLRNDLLVSGGADRVIKIWDVKKGKALDSVRK